METIDKNAEGQKALSLALWDLNMLNTEAAKLLGVTERTLYRWLAGKSRVPKSAFTILELMLEKKQSTINE
jgi:hypothetical protein